MHKMKIAGWSWLRRLVMVGGLLLVAGILAGCAAQEHAGVLQVSETQGWYPLGLHLAYLTDPEGNLTLEQVVALDHAGQFTPSRSRLPALGSRQPVVWARLSLRSDLPQASAWLLEIERPFMNYLDVYIPQPDGSLALWQVGSWAPFSAREIPYRTFVFNLLLPSQTEQTIYVRIQNSGQVALDFTLWAPGIFAASQAQDQFFLGMFYGTLLVVLVYNTLLLFALHERDALQYYLILITMLAGILFFVVDGLAYWLLWTDWPRLNQAAMMSLWALVSASVLKLAAETAGLRSRRPFLHLLAHLFAGCWLVLALVLLIAPSHLLANTIARFTIPQLVLLLVIGISGWNNRDGHASYYRLVWVIYVGAVTWIVLVEVSGLAVLWKEMLNLSRIAVLLALAATSLSVRQRYDRAWLAQAQAQADAVTAAQKAETVIRQQNDLLAQRVESLSDELSAFLYTTILVSQVRDWQEILLPVLERIQRIVQADAICVHLLDEKKENLRLAAQLGLSEQERAARQLISLQSVWEGDVHKGVTFSQIARSLNLPDYKHHLNLALQAHEEAIGMLTCYRQADLAFSPDQRAIAAALAEYLTAAIENQRLRLAAEVGAVSQERQRMARELHDSLNQSIYSLALLARAGQDAQEEGDMAALAENLRDIEQQSFLALREMRILLHELRPPELEAQGLAGAVEVRFNMVERRMGLKAQAWIDASLALSSRSEIEIYRIIIEALNNTLKHARAQEVQVRLVRQGDEAELTVTDDGIGYDAQRTPGSLGVGNMRQRAEAIGGQFEIGTRQSGGTLVRVTFPLGAGV